VKVIGEMAVARFAKKHPGARKPLERFLAIVRQANWEHFPDVKRSFPAADYVSGRIVFDIRGNNYRLVTIVSFEKQLLSIENVFTHEEYDRRF
jgi:mRNA interferase HigB